MTPTPKILIVEDQYTSFEFMSRLLIRTGYKVLSHVTTGIDAIESVKDNAPDLIPMDINLEGDMDGIETAVAIKDISDAPVIYLSTHFDDITFERARVSGAQGYFVKPVRYMEFQTNIEMIINKRKADIELKHKTAIDRAMVGTSKTIIQTRYISIKEISDLLLHHAKALTESVYGYVGYIDAETGFLVAPTLTTDIWDNCNIANKNFVFERFKGLWGWVLDNKKPLLANNPENDHRSTGIPTGHIPITWVFF